MNLKFEWNGIKLEIQNGDLASVEKTMLSAFALIEGGSFVQTFKDTVIEARPVKSARNFVEEVDGVKVLNGIPHYKCAYRCTCNNKGKRFIKGDEGEIQCHQCKQNLKVEPATMNEAHDEEFNYFVAY